jgi:uncharacterized protein
MKYPSTFVLGLLVSFPALAGTEQRPSAESIEQLLEATGSRAMMSTVLSQMDANMQKGMEEALKGKYVSPAQQSIMDEMRSKMLALVQNELTWDRIEPVIVDVYQQTFTQKEVNGMLLFYRSEVGKAMVAKMPQVLTASSEAMRSRMSALVPKLEELQRNTIHKLQASEVLQDPSAPPAPAPSTPDSKP